MKRVVREADRAACNALAAGEFFAPAGATVVVTVIASDGVGRTHAVTRTADGGYVSKDIQRMVLGDIAERL